MKGSAQVPLWVVWVITAVALCLRVPLLDYSFYGDEGFSVLRDSFKLITDTEDRFRPLFFSFLYIWRQMGFEGELGLRLLPLMFGVIQVPLAFLVGRKLRDDRLGIILSVLICMSPMLIEFSQELRMYSMVAAIALAQTYVLLLMVERFTWPRWLLFVLIAAAGVFTHLLYWFFLMGTALTFLRERRALPIWKGWSALAATVLLYVPNVPNLIRFQEVRSGEYGMHFASALPKLLAAFTVGFNYFSLGEQGSGRAVGLSDLLSNLPLVLLSVAAGVVILWKLVWLHAPRRERSSVWLAHELFTIPILIATVASLATGKYFLQPKYLIFSTPFLLLFVALAYSDIRNMRGQQLIAGAGAVIAVIALVHYWQPESYGRKQNWRAAAEVLSTSVNETNALVLLPGNYGLLNYYAPGLNAQWEFIKMRDPNFDAARTLSELAASKNNVYYLRDDVAQNLEDPQDKLIQYLDRTGKTKTVTQLNPRFKLYRWG
ncbi:MAG: glycosyltransferase family 39 protein [Calditrichaeota bacterium]|nr:glycosyltransferase family 39 protein [Calditrichota bacterium]MCB9365714.1 glycosyltransferase family 39 protein [Calditrichota bacterium]